jgi:hypothetical protein
MDFKDELIALGKSVDELKPYMTTEEATKNALIIPFIRILGYNVFVPREVRPEYVCDIGIKKGEKIDFALFGENKTEPLVLIECKQWGKNLLLHESQLIRYFQVSKAKFGILTNGINYRLYTDLEAQNIMDRTPFFEINITELTDSQVEQLKKFHKNNFDISVTMNTAKELKCLKLFREVIKIEMETPSQDFVKYFLTKIKYTTKRLTDERINKYTILLKKSIDTYITEKVNNNLRKAMEVEQINGVVEQQQEEDGIITTSEEFEAFKIVKAILAVKIPVERISYKDTRTYFAINYGKVAQPICRLYFNSLEKKQIGLFNEGKLDEEGRKK